MRGLDPAHDRNQAHELAQFFHDASLNAFKVALLNLQKTQAPVSLTITLLPQISTSSQSTHPAQIWTDS